MTGRVTVKVGVKISWWLLPYLKLLRFFAWAFGYKPDMNKVQKVVNKGIRPDIS